MQGLGVLRALRFFGGSVSRRLATVETMYAERGEKTPLLQADPKHVVVPPHAAGDIFLSQYTVDDQLLKYDPWRPTTFAALFRMRGTVFWNRDLWLHALSCLAIAAVTCAVLRFNVRRLDLVNATGFSEVVKFISVFVGLLLAFHMSFAVNRWLAMRREVLGGLWVAVADLALLLGAHLPEPENRPLKTLVLRYGLASFEILFGGAAPDLAVLQKRGLLSEEECEILEPLHAKAQVPWVWICLIFQRLASSGKLSSRMLVKFYEVCATGRAACNKATIFQFSQFPLPYVHLLHLSVHTVCLLVAVKCGVESANALWGTKHALGTEAVVVLVQQVVLAVAAPLFYGALLHYATDLADPMSSANVEELPLAAHRAFMRDEGEAFHTAGENQPRAISQAVANFGDPESAAFERLMQDRVSLIHPDVVNAEAARSSR